MFQLTIQLTALLNVLCTSIAFFWGEEDFSPHDLPTTLEEGVLHVCIANVLFHLGIKLLCRENDI